MISTVPLLLIVPVYAEHLQLRVGHMIAVGGQKVEQVHTETRRTDTSANKDKR